MPLAKLTDDLTNGLLNIDYNYSGFPYCNTYSVMQHNFLNFKFNFKI